MNKRTEKPVQQQTEKQKSSSGKQQHPILQLADVRSEGDSIQDYQQAADGSIQAQQIAQFQKAADNHAEKHSPLPKKENKTGLPDQLKEGIEGLSGHSLNDVNVHYNSGKPAQLQAHAYAQGTEIHVAPGQEKHLPHEAWHVVQQKQGRVKPTLQLKGTVPVNDDKNLEEEADRMGAKALQFKTGSYTGVIKKKSGINNQSGHPVQRVKFDRFFNIFYNNTDEEKLLTKEKDVNAFLQEMKPYSPSHPEINVLEQELLVIKNKKVKANEITDTYNDLQTIQQKLDRISTRIAVVGVKGDDDMMDAYGKNTKDSKISRIIQAYLDTVSFLPPYMNFEENRKIILQALHPDIDTVGIGYTDSSLGESDVVMAKKRHLEIVRNILALTDTINRDWRNLQRHFGLAGGIKKITLTGSDLHHGAEQVVIIESGGGKKVVYKPRSTAPDAALLGDDEDSMFSTLNQKGANLPTMKFHASGIKGSYVEFVEHKWVRTGPEIQQHYFQIGQLAIAAKLFGVNDLHYENIMAAANGPTIIDGETSFLMNVLTARNFRSNELQKGIFEHVSDINKKLSNNSFYTIEEKQAWDNGKVDDEDDNGENQIAEAKTFDKYINKIRVKDVAAGGKYEPDLVRGIEHILRILGTHHEEINHKTTTTIQRTDQVRVVPIGTDEFKRPMRFYRDFKRSNNIQRLADIVGGVNEMVFSSLEQKGYTIPNRELLSQMISRDFEAGDIPIIHYNGSANRLIWNGQNIGSRADYETAGDVVNENTQWILRQTIPSITESLQKVDDD